MKNWEECLLLNHLQIIDAIKIIDKNIAKIALIVDEQNTLQGTVTDYDVRRAILNGCDMNSRITSIMNQNPKKCLTGETKADILRKMYQLNIRQMPIVNKIGVIVDLNILSDFNENVNKKDNPILIMAGGLGTRLSPLTDNCPKPLLKVGNKPILEIILENFIEEGFDNFYFSVNYKADMIEEYFGNGEKYGIKITYLRENMRLGTAGAMSLLPKNIKQPVIVMNGDLLTKVDFHQLLEFHDKHCSEATMCVREYRYKVPYGVIKFNNWKISELQEKPQHIFFVNAGIYVINPDVFYRIPHNQYFDMTDLFAQLLENNRSTLVFPIRECWMDIGRFEDFEKAQREFL